MPRRVATETLKPPLYRFSATGPAIQARKKSLALPLSYFPTIDAALNSMSAALLVLGYLSIRRRKILAHKSFMIAAFACSSVFLACYLWYHAHSGVVHFTGQGAIRPFYFALLGTHTVLAAVIVPLALTTLFFALRARFDRHKRIARWTLPIWLYVSVTGVVVYWMLYHLYAAR
jgi:putative membrane protein